MANDSAPDLRTIPIGLIQPSKTNPRKSFDTAADNELLESIRLHGVLVPVLVRWRKAEAFIAGRYELVAGERRYRCALKARLAELPAYVKELTDEQALELQLVENLQRSDIAPLEEGAGYVALLEAMKRDGVRLVNTIAKDKAPASRPASREELIGEVAKRIGKSVRYVYARMKLVGLAPEVKQALASGKIEASHADEIVRLQPAEQKKAVEAMTAVPGYLPSVREAKKYIAKEFPRGTTKKLAKPIKAKSDRPSFCTLCGRPFDDPPAREIKPGECRVCHCTRKLPCHLGKKKPCHLLFGGVCSNPKCRGKLRFPASFPLATCAVGRKGGRK